MPVEKLSWAHYRALLALKNPEERKRLTQMSVEQGWGRDQLIQEIQKYQASGRIPAGLSDPVLMAKPGMPYTYRVVKAESGPFQGRLVLDLGFANYFQPDETGKFKEGDIVQGSPLSLAPYLTAQDLFTYSISIIKIIDGDSVPRKTAQEMRVGPSKSIYGNGFQSALSGVG